MNCTWSVIKIPADFGSPSVKDAAFAFNVTTTDSGDSAMESVSGVSEIVALFAAMGMTTEPLNAV